MGNIAAIIAKWVFRFGFIVAAVAAMTILLNFILSMFFVVLNVGVLGDLLSLVQMWLPFNLSVLTGWLVTVVSLYAAYRLAVLAVNFINRLTL